MKKRDDLDDELFIPLDPIDEASDEDQGFKSRSSSTGGEKHRGRAYSYADAYRIYSAKMKQESLSGNADRFYISEKERLVSMLVKGGSVAEQIQTELQGLEQAYKDFSSGNKGVVPSTAPAKKGSGLKIFLIILIIAAISVPVGMKLSKMHEKYEAAIEKSEAAEQADQEGQKEETEESKSQDRPDRSGRPSPAGRMGNTTGMPANMMASGHFMRQGRDSTPSYTQEQYAALIANIKQGLMKAESVSFGNYHQGAAGQKKPIEWIVIDHNADGEATLISKYGLMSVPFSTSKTEYSWEKSTLRKWLNGAFIENAFSESEKKQILVSTAVNDEIKYTMSQEDIENWEKMTGKKLDSADSKFVGKEISVKASPATQDRVYLLSLSEALNMDKDKMLLRPTEYALTPVGGKATVIMPKMDRSGKLEKNVAAGTCAWWLRSAGAKPKTAMSVYGNAVFPIGIAADTSHAVCIRPVIRVKNIFSEEFTIIK